MPDLQLAAIAPVLVAIVAGCTALRPAHLRRLDALAALGWAATGGLAGGLLVSAGLLHEFLGAGIGGLAVAALAGAAAGRITVSAVLPPMGGAAPARPPETAAAAAPSSVRRDDEREPASRLRPWALAVGAVVVCVLLALLGSPLTAAVLLVLSAAVGLSAAGVPGAASLFLVLAAGSAGLVVVGEALLSPARLLGQPVATVSVLGLVLLPALLRATQRGAWRRAVASTGVVDLSAVVVAVVAGSAWATRFRALGEQGSVSQLTRLGEDNIVHLLLLRAVRETGAAIGSTRTSSLTSDFAAYFPGPSAWQASVAGLVPAWDHATAYVATTALLLAALAGAATSTAALWARQDDLLGALGVLVVGLVGARLLLALFEFGFPGQLLVGLLLVAGLLVCLLSPTSHPRLQVLVLLLLLVASWRSWSLGAPVLLLPVLLVAARSVRRWPRFPHRWLAVAAAGALLVAATAALLGGRVIGILDTLTLDGGIFRAVPWWCAFGVALALPLAARAARRPLPAPASALLLSAVGLALLLYSWQVMRTGAPTYYGYKLQYFLLVLGWAALGLLVVARTRAAAEHLASAGTGLRLAGAGLAVAVATPLVAWPSDNHRAWLAARGVLGPDPGISCALAATDASGEVALALGYGSPLADYLATKSLIVVTGSDASRVLWRPVLDQTAPETWPWAELPGDLLVVPGPQEPGPQVREVVRAAERAGLEVSLASGCATPS